MKRFVSIFMRNVFIILHSVCMVEHRAITVRCINVIDWLEISGVAMGVCYLYWEYKASPWLWVASIAMPAIYLDVYLKAGLYADFAISVYYIMASIYGLIVWLTHHKTAADSSNATGKVATVGIVRTPRNAILPLTGMAILITIVLGVLLSRFTDSNVPWADAATTALSIVALWMLARKYLEQWLVWCVVDVAYTVLYIYKGLWPTGLLYLAYATVSVFGYYKWRKMMME